MAILKHDEYHECEVCDNLATEEDAISIGGCQTTSIDGKVYLSELQLCSECLKKFSCSCCGKKTGEAIGRFARQREGSPVITCRECQSKKIYCATCKEEIKEGQPTSSSGDKHVGCVPNYSLFD